MKHAAAIGKWIETIKDKDLIPIPPNAPCIHSNAWFDECFYYFDKP